MSSPQELGDRSPSPTEPSVVAGAGLQPSRLKPAEHSAATSCAGASASHGDDGAMMTSPESAVGAQKKYGSSQGMQDKMDGALDGAGEANGLVIMERGDVTPATDQPQEALSRDLQTKDDLWAIIKELACKLNLTVTVDCGEQMDKLKDELKEELPSKDDFRHLEAVFKQSTLDTKMLVADSEEKRRKLQEEKDEIEKLLKLSREETITAQEERNRQIKKLMEVVEEQGARLKRGHYQIGNGIGCILMVAADEDSTAFGENSRASNDCKRLHRIFNDCGIATEEPQLVRTRYRLLQKLQDVKRTAIHTGDDLDGLLICIYYLGRSETIVTSEGSAGEVDVRSKFDDAEELKGKPIVLLFQPFITDAGDKGNITIRDQGGQPSPAISSKGLSHVSTSIEETLADQHQMESTASVRVVEAVQETGVGYPGELVINCTSPKKNCFFVVHAQPQQVHGHNQTRTTSLADLFQAWANAPHKPLDELLVTDQLPRRYEWDSPRLLYLKRSYRQPLLESDPEKPWMNKREVYTVEGGEGLILNCRYDGKDYVDMPESERDANDLCNLFTDLGLKAVVKSGRLSKAKIMKALWGLQSQLEEASSGTLDEPVCVWLAILSHGRKNCVITSYGEEISEDDIMDVFVKCEKRSRLEKKLKVFIFDKCRSDNGESGSPATSSQKEDPRPTEALSARPHSPSNPCASSQSTAAHASPCPLPRSNRRRQDGCDMVIIHSTSYGMKANSTPEEEVIDTRGQQKLGSWFVQPFIKHCRATRREGPKLLSSILEKTNDEVIQRRSMTKDGGVAYQTPESLSRGKTKAVYIRLVK